MGRKLQKKISDAQALLLQYLWRKHGGPVAVSRLCGVGMQAPNNWRIRGRVPLVLCRRVAEALHEPMWAFNYHELSKLYVKKERPKWIDVVDACGLDRSSRDEIVMMKPPGIRD